MAKRYLIADTHFGHARIMEYENRPFASVEDMDVKIIENWNRYGCRRGAANCGYTCC